MPPHPAIAVDDEHSRLFFRGIGFALAGSILPWAAVAYWML